MFGWKDKMQTWKINIIFLCLVEKKNLVYMKGVELSPATSATLMFSCYRWVRQQRVSQGLRSGIRHRVNHRLSRSQLILPFVIMSLLHSIVIKSSTFFLFFLLLSKVTILPKKKGQDHKVKWTKKFFDFNAPINFKGLERKL